MTLFFDSQTSRDSHYRQMQGVPFDHDPSKRCSEVIVFCTIMCAYFEYEMYNSKTNAVSLLFMVFFCCAYTDFCVMDEYPVYVFPIILFVKKTTFKTTCSFSNIL